MSEPVDTFAHAGLGVRICWDEYAEDSANPREDENLGVMFCEHRSYRLGDQGADDPRGHEAECEEDDGGDTPELSVPAYLRSIGSRVALPLFLYEHSGITIRCGANLLTGADDFRRSGRFMSDGDGWDTSSVGVIYDTPEMRERGWPGEHAAKLTDELIEEALRAEVDLYAAYLEGSVFGFEIVRLDADGSVPTGNVEVLDSCWGFLEPNVHSADAYIREAARDAADDCAEQIEREKTEVAYWAARDVVTEGT